MKALVAYFSPTGTTKGKSMELAADIGGDLFGIRPVQAYSAAGLDWTNPHSRSSMEMKGNSSVIPEPAETADLHEYDTLFVGYPIWWNRAPRIIDTFLRMEDLHHGEVIPFATSGGSGIRNSQLELEKAFPDVRFGQRRLLNGYISPSDLEIWADQR